MSKLILKFENSVLNEVPIGSKEVHKRELQKINAGAPPSTAAARKR